MSVIQVQFGSLRPYKILMSCGHVESRKMSERTAGAPWSERIIIDNTKGGECEACRTREAAPPAPIPEAPRATPPSKAKGRTIVHYNIREKDRKFRGQIVRGAERTGHHVEITPGVSIRLFGMRDAFTSEIRNGGARHGDKVPYDITFTIGSKCEESSYNLVYFGTIEGISAKAVTIRAEMGGVKKHDLATFSHRNYDFDQAKAEARNADTLQCI